MSEIVNTGTSWVLRPGPFVAPFIDFRRIDIGNGITIDSGGAAFSRDGDGNLVAVLDDTVNTEFRAQLSAVGNVGFIQSYGVVVAVTGAGDPNLADGAAVYVEIRNPISGNWARQNFIYNLGANSWRESFDYDAGAGEVNLAQAEILEGADNAVDLLIQTLNSVSTAVTGKVQPVGIASVGRNGVAAIDIYDGADINGGVDCYFGATVATAPGAGDALTVVFKKFYCSQDGGAGF